MDRSYPAAISGIVMKITGPTLDEWFKSNPSKKEWSIVKDNILEGIQELLLLGLIHGDLHQNNISVNLNTLDVYFFDFGWAQHDSFFMSIDERILYTSRLKDNFDLNHLKDALKVSKEKKYMY